MNFACVGLFLFAIAVTIAQGLPSIRASDLSTTTQNSSVERIYGGTPVDATKYPYIVQLEITIDDELVLCGGTLIASQFVVTAAHCVESDDITYIKVTMGSVVRTVKFYTAHGNYNKVTKENDVAVLELNKVVDIEEMRLAKADGSDNKVGATAVALGWGVTEDGEPSMSLEKVSLKIISNTNCSPPYEGISVITKGMMCAWGGEGKDTCQGDSGGPLLSNGALVGIVSFVVNDGNSRSFTEIAAQSTITGGAASKATKTESVTTANSGDSTIQTEGLTVGAVAAIVLALCAVVSLAGFTIYKLRQSRTNDVAEALSDVYYKRPMTPATPSANM